MEKNLIKRRRGALGIEAASFASFYWERDVGRVTEPVEVTRVSTI